MKDLFGDSNRDWLDYQGGKTTKVKKCYESHPPLKVGEYTIYGGSCSSPAVKDANIYIGFDYSMSFSTGHWPWAKQTEEVYYHITDMQPPSDAKSFKQMIAWAAEQLKAGKKVHVGCIGGHGRTGTFLAALVTHMTGELDSITYVRKHYCQKAVETQGQIDFLHKHFGITKVQGSKTYSSFNVGGGYPAKSVAKTHTTKSSPMSSNKPKKAKRQIVPVGSKKNMWKATKAL